MHSRTLTHWRAAVLVLTIALAGCAASASIARTGQPINANSAANAVPAHDLFSVQSEALGERREVNVWTPPGYSADPARRWPVLYMPDGGIDEDFPHVVNTVNSLIASGAIRATIVVGIPNTQRRRDLTGPTRVKADSDIARHVGESAEFRRFIAAELIPEVEKRYRTTNERAIIGESLAGLFVLETMFTQPDLFTHYVALDPSLLWNNEALVDSVGPRLSRMDGAPRSLYLATADYAPTVAAAARIAALLRTSAPTGLRWVYVQRPDLTHATIFLGVQAEALTHALH